MEHQPLLKYASYITGKRVIVHVEQLGSGYDYQFESQGPISPEEYILLESEVREKANAALQSKILLG